MDTSRSIPYLLYVGLALVIIGPGIAPGHLFLLDFVWPELLTYSSFVEPQFDASAPLRLVLIVLGYLVPTWLLQKIVLVSVISLSGIGMYRLASFLGYKQSLALLAGAFFCLIRS